MERNVSNVRVMADFYWWAYRDMGTRWAAEAEIFARRIKEVA